MLKVSKDQKNYEWQIWHNQLIRLKQILMLTSLDMIKYNYFCIIIMYNLFNVQFMFKFHYLAYLINF